MRIIGEIPHPDLKITLFHWNNKYLIKLETPLLEQTFKVPDYDVTTERDILKMVNDQFIGKALERFEEMSQSLHEALQQL